MATRQDVRRIAIALPEVIQEEGRFAFSVRGPDKPRAFCRVWLERKDPKKARVPQPAVLAVRVANLAHKDMALAAEPVKFFNEPHYNGYPAILVKLAEVSAKELEPPEGSRALWYFTAVIAVAFHLRVLLYEEPRLTELFGEEWRTYTRAVPRWFGAGSLGRERWGSHMPR